MKIHLRQPWTNREDEVLKATVTKYGFQNWGRVASVLTATNRTAQECESRWYEYLAPNINHGEWTKEEEDLLEELVETWGSNWRTIAQQLPGRTATQCQEKHGQLLNQASNRGGTTSDDKKNDNESNSSMMFAQADFRHEVRAPRQDAVDADAREKMMLDEARARLANTKGRKDLRKQKDRAMLAAKQRAEIQHQREMKAAAAAIDGINNKGEEEDEDDDFVPISTKDIDRAGLGKKKQKQLAAAAGANTSGKLTDEELREKAQQMAANVSNAAGSVKEDEAVGLDTIASTNNTSAFSFGGGGGSSTLLSSSSSSAGAIMNSNNNLIQNNNNSRLLTDKNTTSQQLLIPRALQEKRARQQQELMRVRQQQQQAQSKQQQQQSTSQQQQGKQNQISSSILSAIQDGGRTKREKEAILRNGATMSFVQWLKMTSHQKRNNQTTTTAAAGIPDHRAIQRVADGCQFAVADDEDEENVQFLILNELSNIAREDQNNNNNSATHDDNNSTKQNNNNAFTFEHQQQSSSSTNTNITSSSSSSIKLFNDWAEQCATSEIANAVKLVEEECERNPKKEEEQNKLQQDEATTYVNEETATFAEMLTETILTQTAEFQALQNRLKSTSNNNSFKILFNDFTKLCQDSIETHEDCARSKMLANITNSVRLWEEECLKSAYEKAMKEYQRVKEERDAAEQKLLSGF